ncbi:hypothetical protein H5T56_05045 [Candidatus Bipolaricaulota bacterium]|nr:hypothetical protein [Candidatus Bipolaricaulota bacterium]
MELAVFFWALGDLPAAMSGGGEFVLGPEPWFLLPLGPFQLFLGKSEPNLGLRLRLLDGPWFLWFDVPPPRVAVGRAPGYALLALVRSPSELNLSWELLCGPELSLFGSLGDEMALGLRVYLRPLWGAALIREGGLSLWLGFSF